MARSRVVPLTLALALMAGELVQSSGDFYFS
jgi:hypothetical protein